MNLWRRLLRLTFIGCSFTKSARSSGVFPGGNNNFWGFGGWWASMMNAIVRGSYWILRNLLGLHWLWPLVKIKLVDNLGFICLWSKWEVTFLVGGVKIGTSFDQHKGNLPLTIPGKEMLYWDKSNLAAMWRGVRLSSSAVSRSAPPCTLS